MHTKMKGVLFLILRVIIAIAQEEDSVNTKDCNKGPLRDSPTGGKPAGCGLLISPKNGRLDLTIGLSQTDPEKAFFSCEPGYNLVGPTTITCKNSSWEGKEPICQPVDCGPPKAPENGSIKYTHTTYQSKAHYFCDACATLVGRQRISCKRSGLWSKTVPKCTFNNLKECPPIELPRDSHISQRDLINTRLKCGEKVKIQCSSGFRLVGVDTAICQPDGTYSWEGSATPPRCQDLNWS